MWHKDWHHQIYRLVLVNRLEGLSLPRNSASINWPAQHDLVFDWAVKFQHKQTKSSDMCRSVVYDPVILLYMLKSVCWRNVLGIMDQCDTKINLVKYVGHWPIFHSPLILPYTIVIDLSYYTHGIYAEGYIVFVFPFICLFVHTSKFYI